jgi:LPXTG-site transpeptidase (sortase) family protein
MKPKILSIWLLSVFLLLGLVFLYTNTNYSIIIGPNQEGGVIGLPIRLKIPTINVDAAIQYVGLDSNGVMDAPDDPAEAAWFNMGPRPGENGSAVIAGHYGWKNNISSVFDDLHKLSKGDKLYIEDENGKTFSFIVSETKSYDPDADASSVFFSSDGKPHLNLVTCEGIWNKTEKSYSKRLVVFADAE